MIDTDHQLPTLGRLARRTLATCIGAVENRAELFALEFEEENDRLMRMVAFGVIGLFLAMMSILLITALIIFLVPPEYRVWAVLGFAILYLAGAAGAGLAVKGLLKQSPFAESVNQIKKDAELLDAFK
ncbi:MAG TPA: phage holin family protein [Verrucomicrobiae bacterium]|jgi:uncharacterized membrane protein YqjE|nr:phage holin family protein [Verrucomicrobiae bacterium]